MKSNATSMKIFIKLDNDTGIGLTLATNLNSSIKSRSILFEISEIKFQKNVIFNNGLKKIK